jgi:broad specificity phosphatase PhoE
MRTCRFITHPDTVIDPAIPVPDWPLSARGRERMTGALRRPWVGGIREIWCSTERKARDGAEILAEFLNLPVTQLADLGENDRSSTGYLPREEFEAVANEFFANPTQSVRGWETAADAQRRVVGAIDRVLAGRTIREGDIAIVAHGGVGTLLLCRLNGVPIDRRYDQSQNNGGNYFAFDIETRRPLHGWRPIEE